MRSASGQGFGQWVLEFLRTPTMIGVTVVAGLAVAFNGGVGFAHDHKSGETTCVEAGGDWDNTFGNCDMP
jgi:hypothetical protein